MSEQKIWLVEFPISQYKENVRKLAEEANLTIMDSRFARKLDSKLIAEQVPKLTKLKPVKPKPAVKTKAKAE